VIPAQDYDYLFSAGAKAIFGPGTRIEDSAKKVLEEIRKARA
jgi:methylmalonyl-CoA mutase